MPDGAPESATTPPVVDYDLPCEECNYNLRGLSGDPVRCPECGHANALGFGEITAEAIARRLDQRETGLTLTIAFFLVGLVTQFLTWGIAIISEGRATLTDLSCPLMCGVLFPVLWFVQVIHFRYACGVQRGWAGLLLRLHLLALGVNLALIVLPAIPAGYFSPVGRGLRPAFLVAPAVLTAGGIAACYIYIRPYYRRLLERVQALQRPRAIEELREKARRRIALEGRFRHP